MGSWSFRNKLGSLIFEGPSYLFGLIPRPHGWVRVHNRSDVFLPGPRPPGICPQWNDTRTLHFCDVFPGSARRLLRRAMKDVPFGFAERPSGDDPKVSFLIGHKGEDRLPQLLQVLASIAGQTGVSVECIVCEQDVRPRVGDALPPWVRYVFCESGGRPYNRSRAFNVAAELARGKHLILHDNDLVVPARFAESHSAALADGWDVANLKRFIFYLSHQSLEIGSLHRGTCDVEFVMQNARGGGSLAISAEAFRSIGGMDEGFIGWGGEDVEFWDRCQTLRLCDSQYLPLIHLWHLSQAGKRTLDGKGNATAEYFLQRMNQPREHRIKRLQSQMGNGNSAG